MVTVYITTNAAREIEGVHQSVEGAARFAYGLGVAALDGKACNFQAMLAHFEKNAAADLITGEGASYRVERHFVAA